MGSQALFLTFSCMIAFGRNNIRAEGTPNITLVRKDKEMWCIAQGEDAFSGLSWVSNTSTYAPEKAFKMTNNEKQDCNVMKGECTQWTGWNMVDSIDYPMPEVLDYRWNDMPLLETYGVYKSANIRNMIGGKNFKKFTISIIGKQDAYIYLCDSLTIYNCYWIIFGGWGNTLNVIRKYTNGTYNDVTNREEMSPLSSEEWAHITVSYNKETSTTLKVFFKDKEILKYEDDNYPVDFKYLLVGTKNKDPVILYYRYHSYSYFRQESEDKALTGPYYKPDKNRVCWSIVYSTDSEYQNSNLEVKLEYKHTHPPLTETLEHTQGKWKHKRVEFSVVDDAEVRIVITGKNGKNFAVGGILKCNPDGDYRKSKFQLYNTSVLDMKCVSLKHPEHKMELKHPHYIGACGDDCTLNCNVFGIDNINCYGTVICKNIGNVSNACFCSSGYYISRYYGQYCATTCYSGFYGINCEQQCDRCHSKICDRETGMCNGDCVEGFKKPFCRERSV